MTPMRRVTSVAALLLLCAQLAAGALPPAKPAAAPSVPSISNNDLFSKSLEAAQQALVEYGAWEDAAEMRRVADIGYRLVQSSGYNGMPVTFYLADMAEPNAFALPGGQIFVTRGMLEMGLSDDMLANLLGHELGHVVLQHGVKMERRATLLNLLSQAALIGVMVTAGGSNNTANRGYDPYGYGDAQRTGDLIQGTAAAGLVLSELLLRSYSREFEDQADEQGQQYAAGAGFNPLGAKALFSLMRERLPQDKKYGYWQTHPFFDSRVRAAEARGVLLKTMDPRPADAVRKATQDALLAYRPPVPKRPGPERMPESVPGGLPVDRRFEPEELSINLLIQREALIAYPVGPTAERLRLERLHRQRDKELKHPELARDYGALLKAYGAQVDEVASVSPESTFRAVLEGESAALRSQSVALYPKAAEVFRGSVYETSFLETFLSNYPDATEAPEASLALGDAYARLNRPSDAVSQYLRCWQGHRDTPAGQKARMGLQNLTPVIDQLSSLQELALQSDDPELARLSEQRLQALATSYSELKNGSEYLRSYPSGPHTLQVIDRLNTLAQSMYGEILLYQGVGDVVKAAERIQKILTYAPQSPAADKLRERTVVSS